MPVIDEDGLSPGELDALRGVLARDPALAAEIELRSVDRPAAAVLAALVIAARG